MKLKHLFFALLINLMIGCASCSASTSSSSASDASSQPQGMLKAFGLKGKVKTLTMNVEEGGSFVLAFDPQGNYVKCPDYDGGETTMDSQDEACFSTLSINNWKLTNLSFMTRFGGNTDYKITSYDSQNRPEVATIFINDELAKENATIFYSGTDSLGNYTKIMINHKNINIPSEVYTYSLAKAIDVKIEYWPEGTTMDDMPKSLTHSLAEELIKKANIKQSAALSKDLKRVVDKEADNNVTLISDGEVNYIPEIALRINDIIISDTNDSATVVFHFTYYDKNGNPIESFLNEDEFIRIADFVYEDGAWKVDDIGWDLVYANFNYYSGESYKSYHNKYN